MSVNQRDKGSRFHRASESGLQDVFRIASKQKSLNNKHEHALPNKNMRDSHSVITNAVKGIAIDDLAHEMDVSAPRMYEILSKDNPYARMKPLIRAIGKFSIKGTRMIKADLDSLFHSILQEDSDTSTAVDLHREAFEAVQAVLEHKPESMQAKELRELIRVAEMMLSGLNIEEEMTPRERADNKTRRRFAVVR